MTSQWQVKTTTTVKLRSIPDSGAAIGLAGNHSVVVDRPAGKAGGEGLGFNGGQLLALAIGGCFCNDLHCVAREMGIALKALAVDVTVAFDGSPLLATEAALAVEIEVDAGDAAINAMLTRARDNSTVSNSKSGGFPVRFDCRG